MRTVIRIAAGAGKPASAQTRPPGGSNRRGGGPSGENRLTFRPPFC